MLTLADGRTRVDVTLTMPEGYDEGDFAEPLELTLTDLTALIDATCQINKPDYRLSASASDTVPDQPLCRSGNATTFGNSNYEGTVTVLRELDETGHVDAAEDTLFTAIGEKGVMAYFVERIGPKATVALAEGDEGWIYEALTDEPQEPSDRSGYVKNIVPLGIQSRRRFAIVAGP
ncbi:hypothetical protein GCM10009718_33300 [Isoptericola halotolerans]|uniref:Uncharacterized protein n=1 Tax=Isoptericola halotolerans TaxID=300560 RepID=A0ABX2A964_9MICO|nr:hypothetical protein [Isoptericola halotolerans]NOV98218.1 hypothetical protein [Isoptericola halotolerans]